MAIRTALTEALGLEYPIVLAPMGSVSGSRLAAAVSNAGGLGLVGGGYGDHAWLRDELSVVKAKTARPWGVGLITWATTPETVQLALSYEPHTFMLSFGDPRPYVPAIKEAGCKLVCQVQDLEGAHAARAADADVIVAQGAEAGGHGATRATLPLVPVLVDTMAAYAGPSRRRRSGWARSGSSADAGRPRGPDGYPLLRGHGVLGPPVR